jgi:hypothetical protein
MRDSQRELPKKAFMMERGGSREDKNLKGKRSFSGDSIISALRNAHRPINDGSWT